MTTEIKTETTKRHQIIRMKNGIQQHYSSADGMFKNSEDRFDGTFEATPTAARELFAKIAANSRRSMPKLMVED